MNANKGLVVAAVNRGIYRKIYKKFFGWGVENNIAYNLEVIGFNATYLVDGAKTSRTLFARDAAEAKAKIAMYHAGQKISGLKLKL
jgi:hypothetical protein